MSEINRLTGNRDWIDLEFVERERTPKQIVEVGIQFHLAGLSLSNTKQHFEGLGVQRSRTAIHNWVQKADRQPTGTRASNYVALDCIKPAVVCVDLAGVLSSTTTPLRAKSREEAHSLQITNRYGIKGDIPLSIITTNYDFAPRK